MSVSQLHPCLVIPNYNHGYAADELLAALQPFDIPTVIIDDCSTDDTSAILDAAAASHSWVRVLHRKENGGKGAAIQDGVLWAAEQGYTHAVCIDADGQHDIQDIPRFLEAVRSAPRALILGKPQFDQDAPLLRRVGREFSNILVALQTWRFAVRDVLCGFRVYPLARVVPILRANNLNLRMGFDVEIVVRSVWEGIPVVNIATKVSYPKGGVSHFRYGRDNLQLVGLHVMLLLGGVSRLPRRVLGIRGWLQKDGKEPGDERSWFSMPERGSYRGLHILLAVLERLGRRTLSVFLIPIIMYMFLCAGDARRAAVSFQRRIIRERAEPGSCLILYYRAWKQFWEFGVSLVDKVISWRQGSTAGAFEWHGVEEVQALLRAKQGVVCMSAHMGHVEAMRAEGELKAVMVNALMFTQHSQGFRRFMEELNPNAYVRVWEVAEVDASLVFQLQECLGRGEIVAILADRLTRNSPGRAVPVPFLGDTAYFPEGPWILASLLQVPVYFVSCMREATGTYRVFFEKIADRISLPRPNRREALAHYVQLFAQKVSTAVCHYPEQWFNFFDFWKPAAADVTKRENG
jgi:predicted LPLAT superfamily acyltransferase